MSAPTTKEETKKGAGKAIQPEFFVIKELFTDEMPQQMAFKAMEEVRIMGELNSKFIVSYVDSFVNGSKVSIIMEYCENGDLEKCIYGGRAIPEALVWRYFI